jgi:hypothetical protein
MTLTAELVEPVRRARDPIGGCGRASRGRTRGWPRLGEQPRAEASGDASSASKVLFDGLIAFLSDGEAASLTHEQLKSRLDRGGRDLIRRSSRSTWACVLAGSCAPRASRTHEESPTPPSRPITPVALALA